MSILGFEFKEGDVVYISKSEHPSLIAPLQKCEENGLVLKELPLKKSGGVDENKFFLTLDSKTFFVVLSHINNQSGVIQPINRISQRIKEINPRLITFCVYGENVNSGTTQMSGAVRLAKILKVLI